jgi:hypothetical protein
MPNRADILEYESIGIRFSNKSNVVIDQGAPLVRTRLLGRWRTRSDDSVGAVSPPGGVVPRLYPVSSLTEWLARRATNHEQGLRLGQAGRTPQIMTRQQGDVGIHDFVKCRCILLKGGTGNSINLD